MNTLSGVRPAALAEAGYSDAEWVAALFAVDPAALGGVSLRAGFGPDRDGWLARLRALLPQAAPLRKLPLNVSEGRLLGGLDLTATMSSGRPVAERGLLAETDGGVVLVAMAERLAPSIAAHLGATLDAREVKAERDGLSLRLPARIGVVALDEGIADDEHPPAALLDRLAFRIDLTALSKGVNSGREFSRGEIDRARSRLPEIRAGDAILRALCAAGLALGVDSIRATQCAVHVACVSAALAGRGTVGPDDAALAARLVLGPRATRIPAPDEPAPDEPALDEPAAAGPADPPDEPATQGQVAQEAEGNAIGDSPSPGRQSDEVILAAAAAIPPGLLAKLRLDGGTLARSVATGRAGATVHGSGRGRPAGTRRGVPGNAARLNLVETLRAAAPWQRLRRRQSVESQEPFAGETGTRLKVHRDDWRVTRLKRRSESTAIFVVDASGSAALHRLGEAKGAVELLLADCYVRRDRVAVIAFRGATAELLLPPTRSLVRAKRSLAGLPGGGGTPLATAIDAATCLAEAVRRKGQAPAIVLLTDGRANVTRDGRAVRAEAEADALVAARRARATGTRIILIDTSPRPSTAAERLAAECGALYLALPQADATKLSRSVQAATAPVHDRGGAGFRPAG